MSIKNCNYLGEETILNTAGRQNLIQYQRSFFIGNQYHKSLIYGVE